MAKPFAVSPRGVCPGGDENRSPHERKRYAGATERLISDVAALIRATCCKDWSASRMVSRHYAPIKGLRMESLRAGTIG